ncbi:MAG: hypothetical protein IPP94_19830 [Ignavibacteria bacterium]|nr:hypothetical protein [Ignavibacteria bacterium]
MRTTIRFVALLLATAAIAAVLPALYSSMSESHSLEGSTMKQDSYPELWKKVDEAIREGKPRTALDIVEKIYKQAKAERNAVQTVKAVAFRVALRAETNEDGEIILVRDIEKEIPDVREPAKSIFHSMLGEMYWSYYQQHQWEISSRTVTADSASDDLRTWDAKKLFEATKRHYLASLAPAAELQRVPLADVKDLLIDGFNGDAYRTSVYDILAHRAVDFFADDRGNLPKPTREFEVTTLDALASAEQFAQHRFETPDSSDNTWVALELYQHLLRAHLRDRAPDALVDLDLDRLAFARRITYHDEKDTAYVDALTALAARHQAHAISAEVGYRIAQYQYDRGDYVNALARCDREIARHGQQRGGVNCTNLRAQILAKEIDYAVESTVAPETPILAAVTYRNLPRVYCRILPDEIDDEDPRRPRSAEERMRALLKRKTLQAWSAALPDAKDYKTHVADIAAPAMPIGTYVLVMSAREDFSLTNNRLAVGPLRVTRLSLQSQQLLDCTHLFWIREADNGAPLGDVTAKLSMRRWNSSNYKYEKIPFRDMVSDRNGRVKLEPGSARDYLYVTLERGGDRLALDEGFYPCTRNPPDSKLRTIFFTDRGLYRPGQTVFFKGLTVRYDADQVGRSAAKGVQSTVDFLDANYQKIASQSFTTNEFGSFQGTFTVPTGVLTGTMTLRSQHGSVQIQVEEYKRPKFEVTFEAAKGTFKLYDNITVKGNAKAYAGANIDGAAVTYRVVRQARYPFWCWWWRNQPRSETKEIAHGITKTAADGTFEITFPALPDKSVQKSTLPVFSYAVTADVTDMSGETRSGATTVSVGYTAIVLSAVLPPVLDANVPAIAVFASTNLNGSPVTARGTVLVEKLRNPARVLRERLLPQPDQFAMSREEFKRAFPNDVWKDENIEDTWPVEKTAVRQEFSTNAAGQDTVSLKDLEPGRYRVTLTAKDPSGETLTLKQFFTAYASDAKEPATTEGSVLIPVAVTGQPGTKATVIFGTSFSDARILYQVERRGVITEERWLKMSGEQRAFSVPIREEDRGGFTLRFSLVKNRRIYSEEAYIAVPWTNKELKITTSVFRDKMLPGSKEEWRLSVKGENAEAIAAELVAAMYDASLDAIRGHWWESLAWPTWYTQARMSTHAFGTSTASMHDFDLNPYPGSWSLSYPRLNLFLLDDGGWYGRGRRYRMMAKSGMMNEAAAPWQRSVNS